MTAHAYGFETSFKAEFGCGGRVLTFHAEYDAPPGMGHTCSHNLIATVSLSSFLVVVDTLNQTSALGRVQLLGTPAEETTGGKIKLVAAGAYKDVDVCLMMHPTAQATYGPESVYGDAFDRILAITGFAVRFKGKLAHAANAPWEYQRPGCGCCWPRRCLCCASKSAPTEEREGIVVENENMGYWNHGRC